MDSPRSITILGKSGSGKDTQVQLLAQKLTPALVISTGARFREIAEMDTLAGRRTKETLAAGQLMPAWFASYLWQDEFVHKLKGDEHLIFGSTPRRLEEAQELDDVIGWLGRPPVEAVLLDVSDEEALARLLKRGRTDDSEANIRQRLAWFERDVGPVIRYYEDEGRLKRVDGVGPVEEIHKRIAGALGPE